ncbi:MAG: hypothetical protein KDC06_11975, partial [Chitinophagaceae bacterium]|nr:hypothetical protein [Chitinophagaceae bacterium]
MRKFFLLLLVLPLITKAQTKTITLEDIFKKGTFRGEFVRADFGESQPEPKLNPEDLVDASGDSIGRPQGTIWSAAKPDLVLIKKEVESIYRRS